MQINPKVASMALRRTTDVTLAMELAEFLGNDVKNIVPIVTFPPAWVRKRQKCAVKAAAWAVRYCDDVELQLELYRSTKRIGVREAIAESEYLSDETREILLEEAHAAGRSHAVNQLTKPVAPDYRDKFESMLLKDESFGKDSHEFATVIRSADLSEEDYFRVYARGIDLRSSWIMSSIVLGAYGTSGNISPFERSMVEAFANDDGSADAPATRFSISEMYVNLDDETKVSVLGELLGKGIQSGLTRPLGKYYAQEMVKHLKNPAVPRWGRIQDVKIFTAKAVEYLIEYPDWLEVCALQPLSRELFNRGLDNAGLAARKLIPAVRSRELAEDLLEVVESQHSEQGLALSNEECEMLLRMCEWREDSADPLIQRIYDVAHNVARNYYMRAMWQVERHKLHPEISVLLAEVERGNTGLVDITEIIKIDALSEEFKLAYVDNVPGAAWGALKYKVLADYVWSRLDSASSDTAMALNVFSSQTGQSLNKLCSAISRLVGTP